MKIIYAEFKKKHIPLLLDEQNRIANDFIVCCAGMGKGKTLLTEVLVETANSMGVLGIFINDVKNKYGKMENCFCLFPPQEDWHLKRLYRQNKIPEAKEAKIFHPMVLDKSIFKERLPNPFQFYTFSVKDLDADMLSILFESRSGSEKLKILLKTIEKLKPSEGIFDLKNRLLEFSRAGTKSDINEIKSELEFFEEKYHFIMPDNFPLNLNVRRDIFVHPKVYKLHETIFIKNDKIRNFSEMMFFNKILKNINQSPYMCGFVLSELKNYLPKSPEGYQRYIVSYLSSTLSRIRNIGSAGGNMFFSDTQDIYDVDEKVFELFTVLFMGNVRTPRILGRTAKAYHLSGNQVKEMSYLGKNKFFCFGGNELKDSFLTQTSPFTADLPRHAHAETHYDFLKMYERFYPENMKDYSDVYAVAKEYVDSKREEFKLKEKEKEQLKVQLKEKKTEIKGKVEIVKQELEQVKKKHKKEISEEKLKLAELFLKTKIENPNWSVREIARKFSVTHMKVLRYLGWLEEIKKENEIKEMEVEQENNNEAETASQGDVL